MNSRIALRTIQKSSNDENDENFENCNGEAGQSRSVGDRNAPDQNSINNCAQNSINTCAFNKAFTVRLFLG